ncbi:MAG: lamin tail domain-containing protein [Methanobacteriota archaeon]|nr:MAG: lamin tail domain-containing protein [Euryarchaeota archaeon]
MTRAVLSFASSTLASFFVASLALAVSTWSANSLVVRAFAEPISPLVLISEFYACGMAEDEYLVLSSNSDEDIDLARWSITDGEGAVVFRNNTLLRSKEKAVISFNSSSYQSAFGRLPDYSVDGRNQVNQVDVLGSFRLADDGDSIALLDAHGIEVDCVLYGDGAHASEGWTGPALEGPRRGEVLRRTPNSTDTDTALDWHHFREFKYGYSEHRAITCRVGAGNLSAFVSPDCSLDAVVEWVASAKESIRLCAYEFDSLRIFETLSEAVGRGVEVNLLLEGNPVGGMSCEESSMLSALTLAGAEVTVVKGDLREGVVKHISALHSKFVVLDDDGLIVTSENFVEDGLPSDKVFGNRGWGIAVRSTVLAQYMASVFDDDSRPSRPDAVSWWDDDRFNESYELPPTSSHQHEEGMLDLLVSCNEAEVTLFVSPDCSPNAPFLCGFLDLASEILVQQLQVDLLWETRWSDYEVLNPLLQHLLGRLRAGSSCRMLLDSCWFNLDRNGEVVRTLTAAATVESLRGAFMMMNERSPISVMHNKGVLLDNMWSVVSSNNWVLPSFAKNRELAAIVRSSEVAHYFKGAFELDWLPDISPPVLVAPVDFSVSCGEWFGVSSCCFHDDRLIAGRSWDVGCDGVVDARTEEISLFGGVPGAVKIGLTVVDSWGNEASTVIVVRVVASPSLITENPPPASRPEGATVIAAALVGYAALRSFRNRTKKNR